MQAEMQGIARRWQRLQAEEAWVAKRLQRLQVEVAWVASRWQRLQVQVAKVASGLHGLQALQDKVAWTDHPDGMSCKTRRIADVVEGVEGGSRWWQKLSEEYRPRSSGTQSATHSIEYHEIPDLKS